MDRFSTTISKEKPNKIPSSITLGLFIVSSAFLCLFYLIPVANLFLKTLDMNLLSETLSDRDLQSIFMRTLVQASFSTLLTLVIGLFPTYILSRYNFKGRKLFSALIVVPFMLPTVVAASAFLTLLPENLHRTLIAVLLVHVFFNIAVVTKIVGPSWNAIDPDLIGSSKTLGASPFTSFLNVTLKLISPSIITASSIIFLFTFTSFGVITVIGGAQNGTLETEIAKRALTLGETSAAIAISAIQFTFLLIFLASTNFLSRRRTFRLASNYSQRKTPETVKEKISIYLIYVASMFLVVAPITALFLSSFKVGDNWSIAAWTKWKSYEIRPGLFSKVDPLESTLTSLTYMTVTVVISILVGMAIAISIANFKNSGKLLEIGFTLPLATSSVTLGFAILVTFSSHPIYWRDKWWMIPIGHCLVALPFIVRSLVISLRSHPIEQQYAAATLGASPAKAWLKVIIPKLKKPLQLSAGVCAAISLGEFGATTFLTRSDRETLPIAISKSVTSIGDITRAQGFMMASVLALTTILIVLMLEVRNA